MKAKDSSPFKLLSPVLFEGLRQDSFLRESRCQSKIQFSRRVCSETKLEEARCSCFTYRVIKHRIRSAQYLLNLDLAQCDGITDQALEAIGASTTLQVLNLHGCPLVANWGLAALATGYSSRSRKKLVLAECDLITYSGVQLLQQMDCLEELNLAECGPRVTDSGGVAISAFEPLRF